MHDDILIHIRDWPGYVRYATHARSDSWRPPLLSYETVKLLDLMHDLTPGVYALYVALVAMYADAPLLMPGGGVKGPRKLTVKRAHRCVTGAGWARNLRWTPALERLEQAGLIAFSTVDGRSVDGRTRTRVGLGRGLGLGAVEDSDSNGHGSEFIDPAETIRRDEL
jgi:hypothetical protein